MGKFQIDISGAEISPMSENSVVDIVKAVVNHEKVEPKEISILFTNDNEIEKLNSKFMGICAPTDVLSFSQIEGEVIPGGSAALGDVIVSVETAKRQAEELGNTLEVEIARLLIHGILHLLGYEHGMAENDEMSAREHEILKEVRSKITSLQGGR